MSPLPEMTPPVEYITADLGTVLTAVRALNDAVRHDEALLLGCMRVDNDRARLAVEMAKAEVVWRQDWMRGRRSEVAGYLDTALALAAQVGVDDVTAWDLTMLTLRRDYANALHTPPAVYAEALRRERVSADEKLVFDAQRHLGDHLHDEGDHEAALAAWEESAQAAARAGHITGVLAQQNLLAALAREKGQKEGAAMLAAETRRWAEAIGATPSGGRGRSAPRRDLAGLPSRMGPASGRSAVACPERARMLVWPTAATPTVAPTRTSSCTNHHSLNL